MYGISLFSLFFLLLLLLLYFFWGGGEGVSLFLCSLKKGERRGVGSVVYELFGEG